MTPKHTRHLIRSGLIVILFLSLEKVGGLVRGIVMANIFGAGGEADAFSAANQLPELMYAMLAGGALSAALIPVYSGYLTAGQHTERKQLYQSIFTLLILVMGTVSMIGVICAPWLARVVLVPQFTPELQQLTAHYMRLVLISFTILSVSVMFSGLLNAHQHFGSSALAPAGQDIGRLTGLLLFVPRIGPIGAGWGNLLGSILHLTIQIPMIIRYRLWVRPRLALKLAGLREVLWLMLPRMVTMGAVQAADLLIIRLASGFMEGSLSAYFYAHLISSMPISFFGWSLNGLVFPTMAERYNAGDVVGLKRVAVRTAEIVWVLMLPSVVGMALIGRPALTLILERGEFNRADTLLVYSVIIAVSGRTLVEPLIDLFGRLFYAQHNTTIPLLAQLSWLIVYSGLIITFRRWEIVGMGLASTVSALVLVTILYGLNKWRLGDLHEREFLGVCGRSIISVIGMAIVIQLLQQQQWNDTRFTAISITLGALTYIILFIALGGHKNWIIRAQN